MPKEFRPDLHSSEEQCFQVMVVCFRSKRFTEIPPRKIFYLCPDTTTSTRSMHIQVGLFVHRSLIKTHTTQLVSAMSKFNKVCLILFCVQGLSTRWQEGLYGSNSTEVSMLILNRTIWYWTCLLNSYEHAGSEMFCFVRFCLSETSCPQEDNYPNSLCIKVNGKLFPLPVSVCFFFPKTFQYEVQLKQSLQRVFFL